MDDNLGQSKKIFYFNTCGQVNSKKTLVLALQRARELKIGKLVVASETGLSALKATKLLYNSEIKLIVVTSAAGTKIDNTVIGDLQIGIPDPKIWTQLEKEGATIVRATDPLYNIGATLEQQGIPTIATIIRKLLGLISSGTAVCVTTVLMATDNGILIDGEVVVAAAGSWLGLDTALVVQATNSVNLLRTGAMQIKEIICKPRNSAHSWPIDQADWMGNLDLYKPFTVK